MAWDNPYLKPLSGQVLILLLRIRVYARADTELKRKALEKAYPDIIPSVLPHWTQDEDLLAWLTNL